MQNRTVKDFYYSGFWFHQNHGPNAKLHAQDKDCVKTKQVLLDLASMMKSNLKYPCSCHPVSNKNLFSNGYSLTLSDLQMYCRQTQEGLDKPGCISKTLCVNQSSSTYAVHKPSYFVATHS